MIIHHRSGLGYTWSIVHPGGLPGVIHDVIGSGSSTSHSWSVVPISHTCSPLPGNITFSESNHHILAILLLLAVVVVLIILDKLECQDFLYIFVRR
jgi:hypothetical protein